MKTEKNILFAFILNLAFSVFEFIGGIFTGSIAIISDAVHDIGDAISIGISFFLEKLSRRQPDERHSYGYTRYSVLGGVITTLILILGSLVVIYNAVRRFIQPTDIHYNGMILFAIVGILVNFTAALLTHEGDSLNQKAVNLHMLEDVLGWLVVLIGAITMRFTDWRILDPIMSVGTAVFILFAAVKNLKETMDIFLEKIPHGICVEEVKAKIEEIDGVLGLHHVHIWSMDGQSHYATMHLVADGNIPQIKHHVRDELKKYGINHATLEIETHDEPCFEQTCRIIPTSVTQSHHQHHSHHHHHH